MFINQPTLTARIHALEKELGVELFERLGKGKGINLSHYGKLYLPYAQRILDLIGESKELIEKDKRARDTFLRIGTTSRIGNYILPNILREFHLELPNIDITMIGASVPEIVRLVADGVIDVGFVNQLVNLDQLENIQLMRDDILLFFSHERLGYFSDPQLVEQIVGETLIWFDYKRIVSHEKQNSYWPLIEQYFGKNNIHFKNMININQLEAIKSLVKQGVGISFLPRTMLLPELERKELGAVSIVPPMPKLGIHFIYDKQRKRPIIESLLKIALNFLQG